MDVSEKVKLWNVIMELLVSYTLFFKEALVIRSLGGLVLEIINRTQYQTLNH